MSDEQLQESLKAFGLVLERVPRGKRADAFNDASHAETAIRWAIRVLPLLQQAAQELHDSASPNGDLRDKIAAMLAN